MYKKFFKRLFDIVFSFIAIIILLPFLLIFTITGSIAMKGNPFFIQERPGRNEQIFNLIKFRSMVNIKKNQVDNYYLDERRLTKYGKFLRKTSIDELPSLINILIGHMSIVGPRPLLVKYLPFYTKEQRHRHDVRPGLTGLAQAYGRNNLSWDEKFNMDVDYVNNVTFLGDLKIIFETIKSVLRHEGISQDGCATMEGFITYVERKKQEIRNLE